MLLAETRSTFHLHPLDIALDLVCQGRLNESLAHFHSALELNPHDSTARISYADALAKLERLPEMLACLEEGVELHGSCPETLCSLAQHYVINGYVRRARLCLEAALQRHPGHPMIARELGRIAQAQGMWETALGYYQQCQHHGLRALALERLGRWGEAYRAWICYQSKRQCELPELNGFAPCGALIHNYDLRYGSILFQYELSRWECDPELGWHCIPSELDLAALIAEFLVRQRVFGWPITAVVAAVTDGLAVAEVIASKLGVRCCTCSELWPDDFVLCFALSSDSLERMRIPNGITFALSGYHLDSSMHAAPDIVGVANHWPVFWHRVSQTAELGRLVAEHPRRPYSGYSCKRLKGLRPLLQPLSGWKERAAALPKPSEDELCQRLRRGDWGALEWIESSQANSAIRAAARDALALVSRDDAEPLLEIVFSDPEVDWRSVWDHYPELRTYLFYLGSVWSDLTPGEVSQLIATSVDVELRECAIDWAWKLPEQCFLSQEALASLDLSQYKEVRLWLAHQPTEVLRSKLEVLSDQNMLKAVLDHLDCVSDKSFTSEVRVLLEHSEHWVSARAGRLLARLGEATVPELLNLAPTCYSSEAFQSLIALNSSIAESTAVELLGTGARGATACLLKLQSKKGLSRCRQALRSSSIDAIRLVEYLDAMGESDEEVLETAVRKARIASARALIRRGHSEFWEVFRVGLRDDFHYEVVMELLEWGSIEALEILLEAEDEGYIMDEIEAFQKRYPLVRDNLPVARERLAARQLLAKT